MKFALNVMHDGVMFSIEDDVPEDFNEDAAAILKDLGAISEEEVVVEEPQPAQEMVVTADETPTEPEAETPTEPKRSIKPTVKAAQ